MITLPKPRILIGACALVFGTPIQAAHYKVFLLGGQSSMFGNNTTKISSLTPAQQAPQEPYSNSQA